MRPTIIARMRAHRGRSRELETLLIAYASQVREEQGNDQFAVFRLSDDSHEFVAYETYRDVDALEEHRASAHLRRFREDVQPLIVDGKLAVTYLEPLDDEESDPSKSALLDGVE